MLEFFPPGSIQDAPRPWIFLGGSIEQGRATDWRQEFRQKLAEHTGSLLNPWRPDWDPNWEQDADSPPFLEQVEWELYGLEVADWIVMYFEPGTRSPISLLELGLFARSNRLLVCCPTGFWRRGNVQITCRRYGVPEFEGLSELLDFLQAQL